MDYIILDTNVFLKENFLEGKRILQLLKLSEEGRFKLILTKIIVGEIKNNYKKQIVYATELHGIFKKDRKTHILRNDTTGVSLFSKLNIQTLCNDFNSKLDAILEKSKVQILDFCEMNIEEVFDKYFMENYPFGKGDKKSEFPDAFSLAIIEKWCIKNKKTCIIFSSDKDLLNYNSRHFTVNNDYENYLDEQLKILLLEKNRIRILEELFYLNSDFIDNQIKYWYSNKLDDYSLYYDIIYTEVHEIEVKEVTICDKDYSIISIDEESIEFEVTGDVTFVVVVTADDEEFAIYDDEERQLYYCQTKKHTITRTEEARITLRAQIVAEDNYDESFEVADINKDHQLVIRDRHNFW